MFFHRRKLSTAILLLMLVFHHSLLGQITIQGTVMDSLKAPIQGVSILLSSKAGGNVLAYSISNDKGFYQINYKGGIDTLLLSLTSLNYEKATQTISNASQTVDFYLKEEPILLNEVVVKAAPISQKGDTISYLVSSFASENDRVIGDVLKKLPGFEVLSDGSIQYNGKSINKFYIENMDLLQGRYNMATQNISAKDVSAVEVFEFHQPVKALRETNPTDRAAVNLKLKNSAKGTLNALMQLGLGAKPLLWENELILLYFTKKKQNISTFKGNNSGNDVSDELTDLYADNEDDLFDGKFLSISSPIPPQINKHRYLFNNINAVASNFLYILPRDYELTTSVSYYNDICPRNSYIRSSYYLSNDSILTFDEQLNARQKINNANISAKIMANKESFYLINELKANAGWNNDKGLLVLQDTINQDLETNTYNLSNTLEIVSTLSNMNIICFYSSNKYEYTPQSLIIYPGVYQEILNDGKYYDRTLQNSYFRNFSSNSKIFYTIQKRALKANCIAGMDYYNQNINSSLQVIQDGSNRKYLIPDSLQNDLYWQKYKFYLKQSFIYTWQSFRIEPSLSESYNLLFISNKFPSNEKQSLKYIFLNPDISILYDINSKWYIKTSYKFTNDLGKAQDSYTGYILQNYRNFNRNDGKLANYKTHRFQIAGYYRNPLKALFVNTNIIYEQCNSNMIKEQSFVGTLRLNNTLYESVWTNTFGTYTIISKNLYKWRTTVSLASSFYNVSSSQMIQGNLVDYSQKILIINPKIDIQITSQTGLSYVGGLNEGKTNIKNYISDDPNIYSITNRLISYVQLTKNISIIPCGEHYYNNLASEGKNRFFVDINLKYKLKSMDLFLSWSNILNTKEYVTSQFDGTSKYVNTYEIRPSQFLFTIKFKLF